MSKNLKIDKKMQNFKKSENLKKMQILKKISKLQKISKFQKISKIQKNLALPSLENMAVAGFHEPSALARAKATQLGANARDSVASELVPTEPSKMQNLKKFQ